MKPREAVVTTEAILLWRRKWETTVRVPYVTREGLVDEAVVLKQQHSQGKQVGGLQPFRHVYMTVGQSTHRLYQLEGVMRGRAESAILGEPTSVDAMERLLYFSVLGELISYLFPPGERQPALFPLLVTALPKLAEKAIALGTVILGWQVLSLAGYVPTPAEYAAHRADWAAELGRVRGRRPTESTLDALGAVLAYDWADTTALSLSRVQWEALTENFYAFAQAQVGQPLQSLRVLEEMEADVLTKTGAVGMMNEK